MTKTELLELIANGEGLKIEFKRDDVRPASLAKEMSALLNTGGGVILLGVEDDSSISGLSRNYTEAEAWVMNIARHNIQPSFTPAFSSIKISNDCSVGVVQLRENSPSKPYRAKKNNAWVTYVRAGSTSVEATRDEETRLFQSAGLIKYESRHVEGVGLEGLSLARIENYFKYISRYRPQVVRKLTNGNRSYLTPTFSLKLRMVLFVRRSQDYCFSAKTRIFSCIKRV